MRSAEDFTTVARIRDAAIEQFGQNGFSASVRSIATAAGVSAALVIHHFGSKEKLREACDAYVIETVRVAKTESMQNASPSAASVPKMYHTSYFLHLILRLCRFAGMPLVRTSSHSSTGSRASAVSPAVVSAAQMPLQRQPAAKAICVVRSMQRTYSTQRLAFWTASPVSSSEWESSLVTMFAADR